MIELEFRLDLYAPAAVDVAVEAFSPFADIERENRNEVEVVRVTAKQDEDEPSIAGEIANYVLGATVDGAGTESEES